jgi:tRNA(Arg) A34 adenosine deaminase TadA
MQAEERFMQMAIDKAKQGMENGNSPFGACIVKNGQVVSCEHNIVWQSTDITAHAEVNAIRAACKKLDTIELADCTIYSTCEPCPMCFSACHWAKISKIVFGADIQDAKIAGFSELEISNEKMKKIGQSNMQIVSHFMQDQCVELFKEWVKRDDSRIY